MGKIPEVPTASTSTTKLGASPSSTHFAGLLDKHFKKDVWMDGVNVSHWLEELRGS